MPIDRSKIKWDDEPIDPAKIKWNDEPELPWIVKAAGNLGKATEEYIGAPLEAAMAKTAPTAYLSRTLGNVPEDVFNIAQGLTPGALGATGAALYNRPLETMSQIGSAALQGVGGFLTDPLGTFERAPVSTAMGLQAANVARLPARLAANKIAETAYPMTRRAAEPINAMLMDVFKEPEIQAALQEAPAGMPTSQALADVNAPRAQAVIRQSVELMPEAARRNMQAQEQARLESLSRIARTPQELAAAEEARSAAATTNYQRAFQAEPPPISPELMNRPSMQIAVQEATKLAAETGEAATPMQALHHVKLALDKIVSKPEDFGLGGAQKSALAKTRRQFIDELSMVPEYARARAEFAAQSVPISQMQVLQELKKAATEPLTEEATRASTFARAVKEAPKTMKKATGQSYYESLEDLLGPEEMAVVDDVLDDFRRTKLADEQAKLGAAAAPDIKTLLSDRVASNLNIPFLNRVWTIANTLIKRSVGKFDEKLATEIAIKLQDPKELNRAIAKARRYERETTKGLEKIQAKRRQLTQVTPTRVLSLTGSVSNAMAPENRNAMAR